MRAVVPREPGGPEVLEVVERPVPGIGPGEVLIRVAAAGLNGADLKQREGRYPMPPGTSDIPGLECAGEVVACGVGVERPRLGERVCALLSGGGYAEYVAAPAVQCMSVPEALDTAAAGGLPETFCTVWANLFERGRLAPGETALIQGGTSGIGHTAIQLAKAHGVRVIATAGTPEKCRACERFGADLAIDYRREDFKARALELTGGEGVDVILDIVAGPYIQPELELLRHEGRLVFLALELGRRVEADFGLIHAKHLTVTGSRLRPRPVAEKGRLCREVERHAMPLVAAGRVRPHVHATFPLTEAPAAHALMEASGHIGKIVLVVG
ncbi:MAG: NAD(P)H-quinone oxidoreductase [Ectothiorhodospiraceae bacterium]|nr:NAD(P)H-quinone oxidoreductase [Ectothiorhodospiraceae bacterium]